VGFMDLERAYDRVNRVKMWEVLREYGINVNLLKAIKSFYRNGVACVRIGREEGADFEMREGLRQGCVMSAWLFNVYMDKIMNEINREVNEIGAVLGRERGDERWKMRMILFADDTVLMADSERELQVLIECYDRVCKTKNVNINVGKSKVMKCRKNGGMDGMDIRLNGRAMEQVDKWQYLGVIVSNKGGGGEEMINRINEGNKMFGAMNGIWKNRNMNRKIKMELYESVVLAKVLYGSEVWCMSVSDRKKLEVFEMKCLRRICGVNRMDRVRNEEIKRRCGVKRGVLERADERMLKWFGHMERMARDRLVRRIYEAEVEGDRGRGRPRRRWIDCVKEVLGNRGLSLEEGRERARDRERWSDVVYGV